MPSVRALRVIGAGEVFFGCRQRLGDHHRDVIGRLGDEALMASSTSWSGRASGRACGAWLEASRRPAWVSSAILPASSRSNSRDSVMILVSEAGWRGASARCVQYLTVVRVDHDGGVRRLVA